MNISSKSKSFDERSSVSKLVDACSTNSRSASEKEMSKLAVRAYGTSCTLGDSPGEIGGVKAVMEEEGFLWIGDDPPHIKSVDGLRTAAMAKEPCKQLLPDVMVEGCETTGTLCTICLDCIPCVQGVKVE